MDLKTEYDESGEQPPATPAATLVIFRRDPQGGPPQLLMVERSSTMRFAGGAAVFPGGRVDESDHTLAAQLGATEPEEIEEFAARITAVRETLEETGLVVGIRQQPSLEEAQRAREMLLADGALATVLGAMGWELDLERLVPFSRWRPKHRHLRIFDTRFYMVDLGTGAVDLLVDSTENTRLFWAGASEALDHAEAGRISVIFPTRRNLERLAQFGSFDEAVAHVEQFPSRMITPFVTEENGQMWLRIPEDAGYPVTGEQLDSAARG